MAIINAWSLMTFAKEHGKMQVAPFCNKQTGEAFKSCVFTNSEGTRTFVRFSDNLGELTPKQISKQKEELRVVELDSHNYTLCKQGDSEWEDVDLGL